MQFSRIGHMHQPLAPSIDKPLNEAAFLEQFCIFLHPHTLVIAVRILVYKINHRNNNIITMSDVSAPLFLKDQTYPATPQFHWRTIRLKPL